MPDNHKLVAELVELRLTECGGSHAYVVGALEYMLADTLTELEINHPKTYQARVEYINLLINSAKGRTHG